MYAKAAISPAALALIPAPTAPPVLVRDIFLKVNVSIVEKRPKIVLPASIKIQHLNA